MAVATFSPGFLPRLSPQAFSPGFRLSAVDVGVLAIGALATAALAVIDSSWSLVVGLPVTHFFLFCNVFRLSRPLEYL